MHIHSGNTAKASEGSSGTVPGVNVAKSKYLVKCGEEGGHTLYTVVESTVVIGISLEFLNSELFPSIHTK